MRNVLSLVALLAVLVLASPASAADPKESAYDRVMRAGAIRCGYIVWPPFMTLDSATGKMGGMNYDYMEAVAANLGLKVEWTQEVIPGAQLESLRSGKIDAVCTADGPLIPSTIKYMNYSTPMAYIPEYVYVRADDKRFDGGLDAINAPEVRVAVIDGDISGQIATTHFPKAARYPLPQLAAPGQLMLDVAAGKADVIINDPLSMEDYFASNPGKLKRIGPDEPLEVIPNTFTVLRGEDTQAFLGLLNQGVENMKYTGKEKIIFQKYLKPGKVAFFPTARPYEVSK